MQCLGKKIPGRRSCQNYIPSLNIRFRYMRGNVRRRIRSHWYRGRQCMDSYCSQSLCTRCKISRDCRPPLPPPLTNKYKTNLKNEHQVLKTHFIFGLDRNYLNLHLEKLFKESSTKAILNYFICNSDIQNFTPMILRKCYTLTHPL